MKFFKNQEEENEWIVLNAQRQMMWERSLTWFNPVTNRYEPTAQALNPRSFDTARQIAKNQLAYDKGVGVLRFTLDDLKKKTLQELFDEKQNNFKKFYDKMLTE